ncbi:MAG: hypothetical protein R6U61_02920 [Thermoplasmata archaeon]
MNRKLTIIIVLMTLGVLLSIYNPYIAVVAAIALWVGAWAYGGGTASGNPYKRMAMDNVPNWAQTQQYKEEYDTGDDTDYDTVTLVFIIGGIWILAAVVVIMI